MLLWVKINFAEDPRTSAEGRRSVDLIEGTLALSGVAVE